MAISEKQRKNKNDRAVRRRQEARKGEVLSGMVLDRNEIPVHDNDSKRARVLAPVVSENMKMVKAPDPVRVHERAIEKRLRYAAMQTHKELAAHVIACGGTKKQAAEKAGISRRQVGQYMASADFRDRIAELQELLGGKIRGRIMKEVNRRTGPKFIEKMELLDLLRVGDRFGLGRGNGSVIVNDNREIHNYESTFNALFHGTGSAEDQKRLSDSGEEGVDFQEFEPTSLALSGGDSPVDG